jgi:glycerol-3-phosphate acyltransferase PlsY
MPSFVEFNGGRTMEDIAGFLNCFSVWPVGMCREAYINSTPVFFFLMGVAGVLAMVASVIKFLIDCKWPVQGASEDQ